MTDGKSQENIPIPTLSSSENKKKLSETELNELLERLETDKTLTITALAKELDMSQSYLSHQLIPAREKRRQLVWQRVGNDLQDLIVERLKTHKQLDDILQGLLKETQDKLSSDKAKTDDKVKLVRELKDLVYRVGTNWIGLANTLKPLGVAVPGSLGTPKDSHTVNILNIFVDNDGLVDGNRALDIAREKSRRLSEYFRMKERLDGAEAVEVEEVKE